MRCYSHVRRSSLIFRDPGSSSRHFLPLCSALAGNKAAKYGQVPLSGCNRRHVKDARVQNALGAARMCFIVCVLETLLALLMVNMNSALTLCVKHEAKVRSLVIVA